MQKHVVVVGAGLGGLAAAVRLSKYGLKVTVFEKNATPGGKMNESRLGNFRFDTGPSLLTMPFVIDDLFSFISKKRNEYLQFVPIDPICRYFFSDNTIFDAFSDREKMHAELHKLAPQEIAAYDKFLDYTQELYKFAAEIFLFTPIHELKKIIKFRFLPSLFKLHRLDPLRTVHQRLNSTFNETKLIQVFDRYTTYNGSDPFQAPATLNIIAHVEYNMGSYYIRGGMYQLVRVMEKLCQELNIEIHYKSPVQQIVYGNKRITGINVNGTTIPADYIVCNADVIHTFNHLITGFTKRKAQLNRLEPSLSGLVFLWSVKGIHEQLGHHNIFFSNDYHKEFKQLFQELRPPDDPTVYVCISSRRDAQQAPENSENWFVLINMPYLSAGQDWQAHVKQQRAVTLARLKRHDIFLQGKIEAEQVFTPENFLSLYGANRGSIYGISSNHRMSAFLRPANRSRELQGLYFVGGSTHPGGGIPLVLLSGKMVSDLIAEQEGII
jgi:phytoene desaturase